MVPKHGDNCRTYQSQYSYRWTHNYLEKLNYGHFSILQPVTLYRPNIMRGPAHSMDRSHTTGKLQMFCSNKSMLKCGLGMRYSVELTKQCFTSSLFTCFFPCVDRLAPPSSPRRVGQGRQQDYHYISASHEHKVHSYSVTIIRKDSFLCSSPAE